MVKGFPAILCQLLKSAYLLVLSLSLTYANYHACTNIYLVHISMYTNSFSESFANRLETLFPFIRKYFDVIS